MIISAKLLVHTYINQGSIQGFQRLSHIPAFRAFSHIAKITSS